MTDLRQAAQQALEALENTSPLGFNMESDKKFHAAITALKAALEQPEQEPVKDIGVEQDKRNWLARVAAMMTRDTAPPAAQPEQVDCPRCGHVCSQRPWVGLTDEDVNKESAMIASKMKLAFHAGMYVAQKILQERNT
jgi:hypothetical protein